MHSWHIHCSSTVFWSCCIEICCVHRTNGSPTKMISMSFLLNWTTTMDKTTALVCTIIIDKMCNVYTCVHCTVYRQVDNVHRVVLLIVQNGATCSSQTSYHCYIKENILIVPSQRGMHRYISWISLSADIRLVDCFQPIGK